MASPAAMLLIGAAKSKSKGDKSMGMGKGMMMGGSEDEESEDPAKEGMLAAARALMKAVKADDAAAVHEALMLHQQLCADHDESAEEEDSY